MTTKVNSISTERTETNSYAMEATLAEAIVERLRGLDVQKVVLFGSHAWGQPGVDSDLDLLVILDEEAVPETSTEHGRLHQRVARHLRDIEREVPIDLIVHTRPMHRDFLNRDSMFARKVNREGQILYEESG
jgi:predicted nucleotidyltransferase